MVAMMIVAVMVVAVAWSCSDYDLGVCRDAECREYDQEAQAGQESFKGDVHVFLHRFKVDIPLLRCRLWVGWRIFCSWR